MFLQPIKSEGLAHLSYIIGTDEQAAVIDPRRDFKIYMDIAYQEGAKITHIFETHRNEDYVIGSQDLARWTGAQIYHGEDINFKYGNPVGDGSTFKLGNLLFRVIKTPGHTFESISIAVSDTAFSEEPIAVFTGDALFIGQVGRTDFFPDRAREVAGLLYDSIFEKILPLGDQVLLYPAHGAGSVCGSGMAEREFSTLGYERKHNPALQVKDRETFIDNKVAEEHYQPPYFRRMEHYNQNGSPAMDTLPTPKPYNHEEFAGLINDGASVLDIRSPEAFSGAYIPHTLAMPAGMIPAYAGWFLDYDREVALVVSHCNEVDEAVRHLIRLGYDRVVGYLDGGLHTWETAGSRYDTIPSLYAGDLKARLDDNADFTLLDVRQKEEYETGHLQGAVHRYLGYLPDHLDEIPRDKPVVTFCGSGKRAIIAASILKNNGFKSVENCLGSMAACRAIGCEVVQ